MKSYLPILKIATLASPQERLISKIGGIPWGLPEKHWPFCCGRPQKLLAQLCHQPPMLDLGAGAVLHVFQCLECGGLMEGSFQAFILDEAELSGGLQGIEGFDVKPEWGNPLIGEVWIEGLEYVDDCISLDRLPEFYDEERLWALHDEFPNIDWFGGKEATRFGGSPRWTGNGPRDFPKPPFEFLLQLNHRLSFPGEPPHPDDVGCCVFPLGCPNLFPSPKPHPSKIKLNAPWSIHYESDSEYWINYTNFATDGRAFVFIDRTQIPHTVRWYWNR